VDLQRLTGLHDVRFRVLDNEMGDMPDTLAPAEIKWATINQSKVTL
jgi:hypothetical protein